MPDTIDKATPADSDLASGGAAQLRALKTAIENLLAIPDAVAMSTVFPFVTTVTDTYSQLLKDGIIICNKGTAFNLTVLAAASCAGRVFRVKNIGAGTVTLVGTIGGVVNPTLVTNQVIEWFSDGTTLYLFSSSIPGGFTVSAAPLASAVPVRDANKDILDRNSSPVYAAGVPSSNTSSASFNTTITGIAVTNGDILIVHSQIEWTAVSTSPYVAISFSGVTGSFLTGSSVIKQSFDGVFGHVYYVPLFGVLLITQTGTLAIQNGLSDTSASFITNKLGYGFLRKQ